MLICDKCNKQVEPFPHVCRSIYRDSYTMEVVEIDLCIKCDNEITGIIKDWLNDIIKPT